MGVPILEASIAAKQGLQRSLMFRAGKVDVALDQSL